MVGMPGFVGHIFGIRPEGGGWRGGGEIQFYRSTGTEKYSFTVLQGREDIVLQNYRDE